MDIVWKASSGFTGLCDRLRAMASMAAIAEIVDAERIYVRWWPNKACPYAFEELFSNQLFVPFVYDFELNDIVREPSMVVQHPLNWGLDPFRREYKHLFADEGSFRTSWKRALTRILDGAFILEEVHNWSQGRENRPLVGIHLRRTDAIGTYKISNHGVTALDDALWHTVVTHAEQNPETQFVVATDDKRYFEQWSSQLESNSLSVTSFPKSFGDGFRQTTGDAVVADVLCLSLCHRIFCSTPSSVLLLASNINRCPSIKYVK